jgi:hypothetical protein
LPAVTPRALRFRRLNRAAVFAGAALAGPACWSTTKKPEPDRVVETTPAPDAPTAEPAVDAGAAPVTAQTQTTQAQTTQTQTTQTQTPAPMATATLHGRVSIARTGEALASWTVIITGPGRQPVTVQTNDRGRYRVILPPGDYSVQLATNHPRRSGPIRAVTLKDRSNVRLDLALDLPEPSAVPMPYGAPPARGRIV